MTTNDGQADLVLYLTSDSPRSVRARDNLAAAIDEHGLETLTIHEVDLVKNPSAAARHGVFATPALLRLGSNGTAAVLYGDLSNRESLNAFLRAVAIAKPA